MTLIRFSGGYKSTENLQRAHLVCRCFDRNGDYGQLLQFAANKTVGYGQLLQFPANKTVGAIVY
jgi:hypothetical protein